jgi:hypothetical protein
MIMRGGYELCAVKEFGAITRQNYVFYNEINKVRVS